MRRKTVSYREILFFAIIGFLSTLINYAVFFLLLTYFSVWYLCASWLGYFSGVLFGYFFNARYTFKNNSNLLSRKLFTYIFVYLSSLLLSSVLLYVLVTIAKLDPKIVNILAIIQTTITNYFGCKFFVFNSEQRNK